MTTPDTQPQTWTEAVLQHVQHAEVIRHSLAAHIRTLEHTRVHDIAEIITGDHLLNGFIEHVINARRNGLPDGALRAAGGVIAARMDEGAHRQNGTGPQQAAPPEPRQEPAAGGEQDDPRTTGTPDAPEGVTAPQEGA